MASPSARNQDSNERTATRNINLGAGSGNQTSAQGGGAVGFTVEIHENDPGRKRAALL